MKPSPGHRGLCVLAAFLFLSSASIGRAVNPSVHVAMGDGITYGSVYDIVPWPPRLDSLLEAGKSVVNAGKSGSRVAYGTSKVNQLLQGYDPGYLLILYGTNDLGVGNPIDYIIGELRKIILAAKANGTVPVVGTLPPIFNGNGSGQSTLNSRIRQLASEQGIQCADVSAAFNNNRNLIMDDGLHPTSTGQQLIASTFRNAIRASPAPVPPVPSIQASVSRVGVPEGGTATFGVRLGSAPANAKTVTVARIGGDADVALSGGASLVFTAANYATYQTVTLAAAEDADSFRDPATIRCSSPGSDSVSVVAIELDNDPATYDVRINGGGPALADAGGAWLADTAFSGGSVWSTGSSVANAVDAPMAAYQAERSGSSFRYDLSAAPNGTYRVKLHFSEMAATAAGARLFHVAIEGTRVLENLDVFAAAGGTRRALVRTFEVEVSDGNGLQIDFTGAKNNALVNAIEVTSAGPPTPAVATSVSQLPVPEGGTATFGVRLNVAPAANATVTVTRASGDADVRVAGGASLTFTPANFATYQTVTLAADEDDDFSNGTAAIQCAANGFTTATVAATEQDNDAPPFAAKINCGGSALSGGWSADTGFSGGSVWKTTKTVANATEAPMAAYQAERSGGSFRYSFPAAPNGTYRVKLHFSEMGATAAGARLFHVSIEGTRVLASFDVFAAAGGKLRATTRTFETSVSDGNGLQIDFAGAKNNALVNAIEIETAGPPAPAVVVSPASATVPEDGTATFGVSLNVAPAANATVTVTRASGDADLRVAGGASLVFTPANYAVPQTVTLAADEDDDTANGTATIQCAADGYAPATVAATERDNDAPPFAAQINCGGSALTGGWTADAGFSGGSVWSTSSSVANATEAPMALYQSERSAKSFRYSFASAPNGSYRVTLHFSEMAATAAGARLFHVAIEGTRVLENLDVFAAAGGRRRALVRTFNATVSDGNGLQIEFTGAKNNAEINGIEIESADAPKRTASSAGGARSVPARLVPDTVLTSEDPILAEAGWAAVDGNPQTAWQASGSEGAWICLGYDRPILVRQVEVQFADGSPQTLQVLASADAVEWIDWSAEEDREAEEIRYLWLLFPAAPAEPPPAVLEIDVR